MYVIILEHPSCVTGNDVHTRVHLFRAFILQILVNRGVFIHSYLQESSLCIKTSTLGKKCGDLFSYFVNFPVDNFKKKNYFWFAVKYTDLMPKIPLYLCQETNLDRVASLPEGWGRGNLHLNDTCTL